MKKIISRSSDIDVLLPKGLNDNANMRYYKKIILEADNNIRKFAYINEFNVYVDKPLIEKVEFYNELDSFYNAVNVNTTEGYRCVLNEFFCEIKPYLKPDAIICPTLKLYDDVGKYISRGEYISRIAYELACRLYFRIANFDSSHKWLLEGFAFIASGRYETEESELFDMRINKIINDLEMCKTREYAAVIDFLSKKNL